MLFKNAKMLLIFGHSIVGLPMLSSSMQECPPLEGQQDYHWLTGRLHKAQFPISLFIDNKVCRVTGGGLRTWTAHLLAISLLYTGSARIQQPTQQWETWSHFNSLHQVLGLYSLTRLTVLPQDLVKSPSHEIRVKMFPITLKFDRHLGSSMPVKFQSDTIIKTSNLATSRLHKILQ